MRGAITRAQRGGASARERARAVRHAQRQDIDIRRSLFSRALMARDADVAPAAVAARFCAFLRAKSAARRCRCRLSKNMLPHAIIVPPRRCHFGGNATQLMHVIIFLFVFTTICAAAVTRSAPRRAARRRHALRALARAAGRRYAARCPMPRGAAMPIKTLRCYARARCARSAATPLSRRDEGKGKRRMLRVWRAARSAQGTAGAALEMRRH